MLHLLEKCGLEQYRFLLFCIHLLWFLEGQDEVVLSLVQYFRVRRLLLVDQVYVILYLHVLRLLESHHVWARVVIHLVLVGALDYLVLEGHL